MVIRVYCVLKECGSAFSRCLLFSFQRPSDAPRCGAELRFEPCCLVGVARTTGLLQGGRRIYIRCPGSSSALLRFLQPELHRTARGRCLDQPLRPVKPTAEPCSAVLLARGATSTPLPSLPSSTLATFLFVASCSEGCCFYPPSGFPVKHLGDFPSSPSVLAKGAASTPSRDAASTSQPCCHAALRCEGAFSRPSRLPRQG